MQGKSGREPKPTIPSTHPTKTSQNHKTMTLPHPLSETLTTHSSLISTLSSFYYTLINLDYLRSDEVQFPPHTGPNKLPLATAALQSANLTQEAEQLLHLLPYIIPVRLSKLFYGEARITLSSKPLSYLTKGEGEEDSLDDERSFGYGDDGEVLLPAWALQIFGSSNSSENTVIYDTRNSTPLDAFPVSRKQIANSFLFRDGLGALNLRAHRGRALSRSNVSRSSYRRLDPQPSLSRMDPVERRRRAVGNANAGRGRRRVLARRSREMATGVNSAQRSYDAQ